MSETNRVDLAVERAVSGVLEQEGYELVLVEYVPRPGTLRLFIDKPGGVTLDDCTRVSRLVGDLLDGEGISDAIVGRYTLEVSSPGLDRPLVGPRDFQRFVGSRARVTTREPLEGRRRFVGQLCEADANGIRIDVEGCVCTIGYEAIERARLVPEY